jgi:ankyrin repeat protein
MKPLPSRPAIEQLKKQAKELLAAVRQGRPEAIDRIRKSLPAAAGHDHQKIAAMSLRLRDAQSCIAREYGFQSWVDLKSFVEASSLKASDPSALELTFCGLLYAGDVAGGMNRGRPNAAARFLSNHPHLAEQDPWLACAIGDVAVVQRQLETEPSWVNQPGGPLDLPPLVAATHSSFLRLADHKANLHKTVDLLLAAGADPNQSIASRWPPASLAVPSPDHKLSALYGAAGQNRDPELTRRLLAAGADPNDGESLYHSLEAPECTRLLLEAGAVVSGTNALYRCLDLDDIATFRLLLSHAVGASELSEGRLLAWAIRRRRSPAHIEALLAAGVDPSTKTRDGVSAYTQALRYGLVDVANVLRRAGAIEDLKDEELFVAACAIGDAGEARRIKSRCPDLPAALSESQLRLLPELAAAGCGEAVRTMVALGWPVDVRGGDWSASALNHAVFRGDAGLTRFLLECGASWTEEHGYGDNVNGTLAWASLNQPVENGDWLACAEALVAHGMPLGHRHPDDPLITIVDGKAKQFSDDVTAFLLGEEPGAVG